MMASIEHTDNLYTTLFSPVKIMAEGLLHEKDHRFVDTLQLKLDSQKGFDYKCNFQTHGIFRL